MIGRMLSGLVTEGAAPAAAALGSARVEVDAGPGDAGHEAGLRMASTSPITAAAPVAEVAPIVHLHLAPGRTRAGPRAR